MPPRSPRTTSVLKTCSGGMPIFAATVSAVRSLGSPSYSRSVYLMPRPSRMRVALVFMTAVAMSDAAMSDAALVLRQAFQQHTSKFRDKDVARVVGGIIGLWNIVDCNGDRDSSALRINDADVASQTIQRP